MKKLIYPVLAFSLIACTKEPPPVDEPEISFSYDYNILQEDSSEVNGTVSTTYIGQDPWHLFVYGCETHYRELSIGADISDFDGDFTFGYVREFVNGTADTIYGSGYITADTVYCKYYYQLTTGGDIDSSSFHSI